MANLKEKNGGDGERAKEGEVEQVKKRHLITIHRVYVDVAITAAKAQSRVCACQAVLEDTVECHDHLGQGDSPASHC